MRAAIYFTPPADDPLTRAAALWLGRDAFTDKPTRPPDATLDPLVAEPARYGFHATLRSPFRLRYGVTPDEVRQALVRFAAGRASVLIPRIALARLGGFLALVPDGTPPDLHGLEGEVLAAFEPFRAPLGEAERARRRPERLTERQLTHLDRWGYPFVREDFRFHMTLTNSLGDADAGTAEAELRSRFAALLDTPLRVDGLALFVEEAAGAPFRVDLRVPIAS